MVLLPYCSTAQALPSHYNGSRTNHQDCVSVSANLSLFSLLSLMVFLFHSLRQLPSPTCPQSVVITFFARVYSIPLALPSISLFFFYPLQSVTHLSSLLLCPLIRSGLHLTDCTLFCFFSP